MTNEHAKNLQRGLPDCDFFRHLAVERHEPPRISFTHTFLRMFRETTGKGTTPPPRWRAERVQWRSRLFSCIIKGTNYGVA